MRSNPLPHQKIIFVCTNRREAGERVCCANGGGCELRDTLKAMVKARQLRSKVRVSASGCMDKCEDGPNVMIFPDNIWLSGVGEGDASAILDAVARSLETNLPVEFDATAAKQSAQGVIPNGREESG